MATEVVKIIDPDGTVGVNDCAYVSLADWESDSGGAGSADLVTADKQITAKCRCTGGTADGAAVISGLTTNSTCYPKILTDPSESYRHAGKYPTGNKYRIEASDTALLSINDEYARIIGIAIGVTVTANNTGYGISAASLGASTLHIGYCVIKALDVTGSGGAYGIYLNDADITTYVYNTVVHGFISANTPTDSGFQGISFNAVSTGYVYSCTVFRCYRGIRIVAGTVVVTGSISANNTDDISGTATLTYSAGDDADFDSGTGNVAWDDSTTTWGAIFTDYANGDFSLKNYTGTGKVIGVGTDNPGSGLYSDDIIGTTRSSTWDIGAFEYYSAAPPPTVYPQLMMMGMGQ